jgi:hypothetical protein
MPVSGSSWKPGESGNPKGRPIGARNNLSQSFLNALLADWEAHGREALAAARLADPATYCMIVVRLLPRETNLEVSASQALLDALKAISPAEPLPDEPPGLRRGGPVGHA